MKKNKLELTDKEYDALRALLYQTTTSAYAKAVGCAVFMAAHLELFQMKKKRKTLNDSLNKRELSLLLKRLKESKRSISFAIMS